MLEKRYNEKGQLTYNQVSTKIGVQIDYDDKNRIVHSVDSTGWETFFKYFEDGGYEKTTYTKLHKLVETVDKDKNTISIIRTRRKKE